MQPAVSCLALSIVTITLLYSTEFSISDDLLVVDLLIDLLVDALLHATLIINSALLVSVTFLFTIASLISLPPP